MVSQRAVGKPGYGTSGVTGEGHRENALPESLETLRALTEITSVIICIIQDGRFRYVNPAFEVISGYSRGELLSMDFLDLVQPDARADAKRQYVEWTTRPIRDDRYELKGISKRGAVRWIEVTAKTLEYQGRPALLATGIDITERRQAAEALRESEERLRLCITTAHFGTIDWDLVSDRHVWSTEIYDIFGISQGTSLTLDYIVSFIHPEDRQDDVLAAGHDPAGPGAYSFDYRITRASDGKIRWVSQHMRTFFAGEGADRKAVRVIGVIQDITERKVALEALRESEGTFRVLAETSPAMIWLYQGENLIFVNDATERLTGYTKTELLQMKFWDLAHPDFQGQVREYGLARQRGEQVPARYEIRIKTRAGDFMWVEVTAGRIAYRGKPAGIAAFFDIHERKRTENELKRSQYILARSQEIASIGNWAWNVQTGQINCSDELLRILGFQPRECLLDSTLALSRIHPDDLKTMTRIIEKCSREGALTCDDFRILLPDGSVRYLNTIVDKIVRDDAGNVKWIYGIAQDITGRKLAEQALKEAKAQADLYLDLMGHDISNMNQIGIGFLELAIDTMELDEGERLLLAKPLEAFVSSSRLIENLRKLQKVQAGELRHHNVDLGQVLEKVRTDYSSIPGRNIRIDYLLKDGCNVKANELLYDLFSNLVGNAIKHTHREPVIGMRLERSGENGKNWYVVSVEDNGPGIPDVLKPRLFSRNLRGDTNSKGSGLGLYLVKTLVNDYRGDVRVEDRVKGEPSLGSRFVVRLPAAEG